MEKLFRRSLADLVRGIRANKKDEHKFITRAIQEIKDELKLANKDAKVVAVQKLTYLHMLGYDMSWAAFNVIEVMSSESFFAKRIGYLAASQCFTDSTDVIILATSLLKRDITSVNEYETGVALNALANICTPDLAQDLAADTLALVTSSRPYVRKKATLVLYKIFLRFPQALRPSFPRLKEKLEDPDPTVVSAAVNVICELARKNPKNYLRLAPVFFKLLTTSSNNWMLIKIIKLMGALAPLEKRLAKKLVAPLTDIMNSTPAMSLLYECISTCTIGLTEFTNVIRLCISKLRLFIEDSDQNLKYLGLLALYNIMKTHPKAVLEHRDMVIYCLDDDDLTIRQRALELLTGMVTRRNLMDIIGKLMDKFEDAEGSYRDDLVEKVIEICSQENYKFITDFEWYINILMELTHMGRTIHGAKIRDQFMDVCIRVNVTRPYGVQTMVSLVKNPRLVADHPEEGGVCEVLYAAAYIIGEFGSQTKQPKVLLDCLLQPLAAALPGHVQSVFVHNALKIAMAAIARNHMTQELLDLLKKRLPIFSHSTDLEVQERACFFLEVIGLLEGTPDPATIAQEMVSIFSEPLNPVAARAQKKVPVPAGVDLDAQINSPPPSDDEDDLYRRASDEEGGFWGDEQEDRPQYRERPITSEERHRRREQRRQRENANPFYLGDSGGDARRFSDEEDFGDVQTLTPDMLDMDGPLPSGGGQGDYRRRGGRRGGRRRQKPVVVLAQDEMPEDARPSDEEDHGDEVEDELGAIDLTSELRDDEVLATKSYPLPGAQPHPEPAKPEPEKRRRRPRRSRERDGERRSRAGERDREGRPRRRRRRDDDEAKAKTPRDTGNTGNLLGLDTPSQPAAPPAASPPPAAAPGGGSAGDLLNLGSGAPASDKYSSVASPPSAGGSGRAEGGERRRKDDKGRARKARDGSLIAGRARELEVKYALRVNPSQPNMVLVVFEMTNKSKKRAVVTGAEFKFERGSRTRVSSSADVRPTINLHPRDSAKHNVLFEFDSFTRTQELSGSLQYAVDGASKRLSLTLCIPSSTFIQPVDISERQFEELMTGAGQSMHSATGTVEVADVRSAIAALADQLHLKIVNVSDSVFMYGRTIQQHDVCVLVKRRDGSRSLRVDIKTTDGDLSRSLVEEAVNP